MTGGLPARFEAVSLLTSKKLGMRLGLEGGKIVRGGFLESVLQNQSLGLELKNFMARAITSQSPMKDFTAGMSRIITGAGEKAGGYEKQFERFAYDLYNQYDAAYNLNVANEFGMNHFIYQGGLIKDSRDFCREHNDRVWTREEAELWPDWTPSKAMFITDFKQKDLDAVPSYLAYPGYEPLIDRGGYNCRHMLGWIDEGLAKELRPDLKKS